MSQFMKSTWKGTKKKAILLKNVCRRTSVSDLNHASALSNADCTSLLELSFSAINTPQCDNWKLVLVLLNGDSTEEIGRTEVIADGPYAELPWPENIPVKYRFGAYQSLIVRVHYVDQAFHSCPVERLQLQDQTLLAESRCNLCQIVTAKNRTFTFALEKKQMSWQIGELRVRAEETVASTVFSLKLNYCPTNAMSTRERGTEGQFLKLSKLVNKKHDVICTTELVTSYLNPEWSVYLTMQQIGSKDAKLVIEGFSYSSNGKDIKFGEWQTSVSDLKDGKKKKVGKTLSVEKSPSCTFLDYFSNYKLCYMVAVEFSATNGRTKSLNCWPHSDSLTNGIPHLQVIKCVGEAIELYDSYRYFPAYGFGGKTSISGETSSCFNLNLNADNCEVNKVKGIIAAYQSAVAEVELDNGDDPASLSEVIKIASDFADNSSGHSLHKYYVLLIIMDEGVFEVQKAIDSLVDASQQPLSILIVGMADGKSFIDLKIQCEEAANNGHLLKNSKGVKALRDTVLCMPYSELPTDDSMAETLLKGIPKQYCAYMQKKLG